MVELTVEELSAIDGGGTELTNWLTQVGGAAATGAYFGSLGGFGGAVAGAAIGASAGTMSYAIGFIADRW